MPNDTAPVENKVEALVQQIQEMDKGTATETKPTETDVDAIALAEAQKAAETAKAEAAKPEAKTEEAKAAEPEPKKPEEKPAAKPQDEQIMIPKARFDEIRRERDQLIAAAAYHKGKAEAVQKPEAKTESLTPEQQIAAIGQKIDEVWAKVDSGDLTYADARKQERELEKAQEALREPAPAKTEKPKLQSDLYLEEKTQQIESAHPYLAEIQKSETGEADFKLLAVKAVQSLAKQGVAIPSGDLSAADALLLRAEIGRLSDIYGPALTGKTIELPGKKPEGKPGSSKETQAREKKLDLAQGMPPDLTATRSSNPMTDIDPASLTAMNEEDITKLPAAVRDKVRGNSW